jgi:hypothetical protein
MCTLQHIVCTVYLPSLFALAFILFHSTILLPYRYWSNCFIIDYCQLFMLLCIILVSDRRKVGCKQTHPIRYMCSCVQCAIQRKSVQCGAMPCMAHVEQGPVMPPHQKHPLFPGHWGFSLLAALKKDGSGQYSGQSRTAQSRTCGYWTVYVHIVLYLSFSNTVLWNIPQMVYLHSTDVIVFRFDQPHHRIKNFQVRSSHFPGLCHE